MPDPERGHGVAHAIGKTFIDKRIVPDGSSSVRCGFRRCAEDRCRGEFGGPASVGRPATPAARPG